ncbi:MAG TPA: metal ABC transporter substrate-binding protein [Candidatus Glassbacteria bacterium]|nr:metal ABC transporter substrate-binding protein [Candidatus Glassbacteria bacterium]
MKHWRKQTLVVVIITSLLLCFTLQTKTTINIAADEPLRIVASISIVADIASQIGKGIFTVESIVKGNEDPHTYEQSPADIQLVAEADLFIRFGSIVEGLEPWVQSVLDVTGVNVLELVNETMVRTDPLLGEDNPHVWMDPSNIKTMADSVFNGVALLDPTNIVNYTANLNSYKAELDDLLLRISNAENIFNGTKVVVHHPSFMYLLDLLGIERVGVIEKQEGIEPSPQDIQDLMEAIATNNVSFIINQPQLDDKDVNEIARETGIQITELTPLLGVNNLEDYISMIDYDLLSLANPFDPPEKLFDVTTWILTGIGGAMIFSLLIIVVVVRRKHAKDKLIEVGFCET